jgi:hypothetical protein
MFLRKLTYKVLLVALAVGFSAPLSGQLTDTTAILDWRRGQFPKEKEGELYQIKANGFYRFLGNHTLIPEPYILNPSGFYTPERRLFIGDDTQFPNLLVNLSGRPNKKVSWGFDVFAFQFLTGQIGQTYNGPVSSQNRPTIFNPLNGTRLGQRMGLNLGLNLYGSYLTKNGTFNVRMGGIHWFSISDLTLGGFIGYNRFMLTERNPWDPIGQNIEVRYAALYGTGGINQDLRFGERAVQGTILEGINLPNGWSFAAMYGKTELAAGVGGIPNVNVGGRLRKSYGEKNFAGFNSLNNETYLDSINTLQVGFNIHTLEWMHEFNNFTVHAEGGLGRYVSPNTESPWGEALNLKLKTKENITGIPLEFHFYQISPKVLNNNAIFFNSSVLEARAEDALSGVTQSANVLQPVASSMQPLGLMTNNRRGLNLNTDFELGDIKISAGYGVATEIADNQNFITFSHFVNQLTRSRFWRFAFDPDNPPPVNLGPYARYDVGFRQVFNKVNLPNLALSTKTFNQAEIHAKYKTKLFYRNFYANFLGRYYTISPDFGVLPNLTPDAFLRQYSSELEMFYQLSKPIIMNTYLGYERVLGSNATELNYETQAPLNQTGWGAGFGFDISLGRNAGLYLRHRWFFFEDTSFALDQFRGQETLAELTVYF